MTLLQELIKDRAEYSTKDRNRNKEIIYSCVNWAILAVIVISLIIFMIVN